MWRRHPGVSLAVLFLGSLAVSIPPSAAAVKTSPASPQDQGLFTSNDLVEFVLEANWDELKDDRDQESPERPGRVLWMNSDGREVSIPIQLKTRGFFRLRPGTCSFPPFRLNFPSEGTEGTVFRGQDKLKLVTHCRDRDDYEQNVLEEYLAYRIYNLLTDVSLRVRLARITYVDSRGRDDPVTRMAFLIEDGDAMAARLDGMMLEVESAPASQFQQEQAALMYLFQYMIGNTDWSLSYFHNVKVTGIEWDFLPVPYDFDWSGLVDASYAVPNQKIAHLIDDVRERLYWGVCNDAIDYQTLFSRFNEKKEAVMELVRSIPGLSEQNQEWAIDYLEEFYEIINDDRAARWSIVDACRKSAVGNPLQEISTEWFPEKSNP